MSVIVKGMKMTKNCLHCDFDDSYGICACRNEAPYVCEYSAKQRPSWCPLEEIPSAQPETHEERTETHACDCISRQAAIDAILAVTGNSSVRELYEHVQEHGLSDMWSGGVNAAIDIIIAVPSVQPEQTNSWCINSWCNNCKEYDKEKHSCPRFNRVIKQTLDEVYAHAETEAEARFYDEIVRCKECKQFRRWIDTDICFCDITEAEMSDNDFCSKAERRTDDTD